MDIFCERGPSRGSKLEIDSDQARTFVRQILCEGSGARCLRSFNYLTVPEQFSSQIARFGENREANDRVRATLGNTQVP